MDSVRHQRPRLRAGSWGKEGLSESACLGWGQGIRLLGGVGQEAGWQRKRKEDASAASLGSGLRVSQNRVRFREEAH